MSEMDDLRDAVAIVSAFRADNSYEGLGDQAMAEAVNLHGTSSVIFHLTGLASLILDATGGRFGIDPDDFLREIAATQAQVIEDHEDGGQSDD